MATETTKTDFQILEEKISKIHFAMLVTADQDGSLRSRPMGTQKFDGEHVFEGNLYFFTKEHSAKSEEIQHDQSVNLAYADPSSNTYVSVTGTAQISKDKAMIKELWNPALKAWFPDGVDDPEIALIVVDVKSKRSSASCWCLTRMWLA
ncbi:MAG: general stress protein [Proteobacteria bacterium]|nr:MAG: general stress protein [Pseudomonadota bacterium]